MIQRIWISTFHIKGRFPPEGAGKNKQPILGFWRETPITIYILKLHDTG